MKFVFIGDGDNDPQVSTHFGYTFELNGEAVDVKEKEVIAKLEHHSHFKKANGRKTSGDDK